MKFENAKVVKIGKGVFYKLKWQQKTFWCRNRWEWNPKLQASR